jgi:hypothetical protein
MAKVGHLLIGLLCLLFLANTCAAVKFDVAPDVKYANPGDTVNYGLAVNLTADELAYPELLPITEVFSVDNERTNWVYSFSKNNVTIDSASPSNTSVLSITVPQDATPGEYRHNVSATGYDKVGKEYGFPTSLDIYVVNTNVQVPEFPSIALPVAAVLGMVAIFGRKKEI